MKSLKNILQFTLLFSLIWAGSCKEDPGSTGFTQPKQPEEEEEDTIGTTTDKPNIVIVIADDLTTRDLSCYGGTNLSTSNIDRLAREGMRFTKGFTSSAMCTPSRTALFTGIYPVRSGAHGNHERLGSIKEGVKSISHYLGDIGYRVGLTGKKHIFPLEQFQFEIVPGFTSEVVGQAAEYNVEEVKPFMTRDADEPFCLVIASTLPHAPWTVGDASQFNTSQLILHENWYDTPATRNQYARYLAEVSALDKQVGDVMNLVKSLEMDDNTLFLFLGEQGAQFPGEKWTNWDQGIRSAVIARYPGVIEPGTVADDLVQYVDVIPTILDLIGEGAPQGLDGVSFANVLTGETNENTREYGFAMHTNTPEGQPYPIRTVFNSQYKLIWNLTHTNNYFNKFIATANEYKSWKNSYEMSAEAKRLVDRYEDRPEFEFYDLENDPYEMDNLIDDPEMSGAIQEMKSRLDTWMVQQGDVGASLDQ